MTTQNRSTAILSQFKQAVSKVIRYLSDGAIRSFRPSNDDYPKTGVQPFEDDIPKHS